ncbi:hypothetical protein AUF16_15670 [Enterococcus avium]|nr:hypothetical protein AUF16_15670 [Enterococcus avium]
MPSIQIALFPIFCLTFYLQAYSYQSKINIVKIFTSNFIFLLTLSDSLFIVYPFLFKNYKISLII